MTKLSGLYAPDGSEYATLTDGAGNVVTSGTRNVVINGIIANSAATYSGTTSNALSIGGITTISTGLPAGTIINSGTLRFRTLTAVWTSFLGTNGFWFNANPINSTITDGNAISIVSADIGKVINFANTAGAVGSTGGITIGAVTGPKLVLDASGNCYFALVAIASNVFTTANAINYDFEFTY